jgi:hypothetical protein
MGLDLGAMINASQKQRVNDYLAKARDDGIPVIAEGKIAPGVPAGGYYVTLTLFGPVPHANRLACEEVFGPVLSAMPFADEADALRLANGTPYGLVAAVWTRDGARQMRMVRGLRAGQVFVNAFGAGGGRAAVRRRQEVRPRSREGFRGAVRILQDRGVAAWLKESFLRLEGKAALAYYLRFSRRSPISPEMPLDPPRKARDGG